MTAVPHSHPLPSDAESRLRGLLEGTLPPEESTIEHLRNCEACRAVYDGVAAAEHGIAGSGGVLGVPALERVGARLQRDLPVAPRRQVWVRWAAIAATAASVLILAGRFAWTPPADDGFTARGGAMVDGVGIRVFHIGSGGAVELKDGDTVKAGDELGASVTTGPYATVALVARIPEGNAALSETTLSIARGAIDEALTWTVEVPDSGTVDVEASFSDPSGDTVPPVVRRAMNLRVEGASP